MGLSVKGRVDRGAWPTGLGEIERVDWGAWSIELNVRGRVGWGTWPGRMCERESRLRGLA